MKHLFLLSLVFALAFGTLTSTHTVATPTAPIHVNAPPLNTVVVTALQQSKTWREFVQGTLRAEIEGMRNANITQSSPQEKARFVWATGFLNGGKELQTAVMYFTRAGFDFNQTTDDLMNAILNEWSNNNTNITGIQ